MENSGDRRDVEIQVGSARLEGFLHIPSSARGLVVFVHGSGSSRFSPRNQYVADVLGRGGVGTLLFDLLTGAEAETDQRTRAMRFDIDLLGGRATAVLDWLVSHPIGSNLPIGLFGASTGAAAALISAALRPTMVAAVVSRGGRPDLALPFLPGVRAPTLLLVGELDRVVIDMNRRAAKAMQPGLCRLEIVRDATHLFEEPGALELVATRSRDWFLDHFSAAPPGQWKNP